MENYGKLYIVSTPIGNMNDITLRAIDTLKTVDVIVCEDTKTSKKLLLHLGISKKLISYNVISEAHKTQQILDLLKNGDNIALISDAGTPLIADPGYLLVKSAREQNIKVITIPGCSSVIASLSISGIPCSNFVFLGFLERTSNKRKKTLQKYQIDGLTLVLFESPKRILNTLKDIQEIFGDNQHICLARELTKIYEEVITNTVENLIKQYEIKKPLGEFVIILRVDNVTPKNNQEELRKYIKNNINKPVKSLSKEMADIFNMKKSILYEQIINFKKEN